MTEQTPTPTPDERDRAAELSQVEVNILNELWDNFTPEEYDAMIRAQELSTQAAYNTGLSDGRAAARAEGEAEGRVKGLEEARSVASESVYAAGQTAIDQMRDYVDSIFRAAIDAAREGGEGR